MAVDRLKNGKRYHMVRTAFASNDQNHSNQIKCQTVCLCDQYIAWTNEIRQHSTLLACLRWHSSTHTYTGQPDMKRNSFTVLKTKKKGFLSSKWFISFYRAFVTDSESIIYTLKPETRQTLTANWVTYHRILVRTKKECDKIFISIERTRVLFECNFTESFSGGLKTQHTFSYTHRFEVQITFSNFKVKRYGVTS